MERPTPHTTVNTCFDEWEIQADVYTVRCVFAGGCLCKICARRLATMGSVLLSAFPSAHEFQRGDIAGMYSICLGCWIDG